MNQPQPSGRSLLLVVTMLLTIALAGYLIYIPLRARYGPPVPPEVNLADMEPAVAQAVRTAREQVLRHPRSADRWGVLGEVFIANEMDTEALVCFAQAERLDPSNPRWPYFQGGLHQNWSQLAVALSFYERAAQLADAEDEANSTPRLMYAETLAALDRPADAERQYQLVLERQPQNPRAHFGLGLLAVHRGQWKDAEGHLLRAVDAPQARKRTAIQLASVCLQRGDHEGAEKYQRQAAEIIREPDWPDPFISEYLQYAEKKKNRYRRAEELEMAGRFAEAIDVVRPLAERFPDDYLVHLTLGKLLAQANDLEAAETHLRKAVELGPDKVQSHYYLGLLLFRRGEAMQVPAGGDAEAAHRYFEEAAEQSQQALAGKPDYGFAHLCRGLSFKYLGRRDDALASLSKAVQCNPEFGELHMHLGMLLADVGRIDEARSHLQRALNLRGVNEEVVRTALNRLERANPKKP
jgi:tetratricopeptide (TPR) repeat protein